MQITFTSLNIRSQSRVILRVPFLVIHGPLPRSVCILLGLDADEINSYLHTLRQDKDLSDTYFKPACGRQACRLRTAVV